MIEEIEIWQCAQLIVTRYGVGATPQEALRADQVPEDGDMEGCTRWHSILDAIERLQVTKSAKGEKVHWTARDGHTCDQPWVAVKRLRN